MTLNPELNKCFVCKSAATVYLPANGRDTYMVQCPNWGAYEIAGTTAASLRRYFHYPLLSEALNKLTDNEIPCHHTANLCEIIETAGLHLDIKERAETLLKDIYQKELEAKQSIGVSATSRGNIVIDIEMLSTPEYEYAVLAGWPLLHEKDTNPYAIVFTEKGEKRAKELMV